MTSAVVRELSIDERERALCVQVMAFASDPVMRWLYPEARTYLDHFAAFAEAFAGRAFAHGTAWVAGDFGGVSLWLPPGVAVDGDSVGAALAEGLHDATRDAVFEVLEQMDTHHIDEPHWYLPMIGVDPSHQGKGLGSALLAHALERCDEAALPAYLESSNPANLPLYERHGFRLVDTIQVGSAPPVFPMLRSAR